MTNVGTSGSIPNGTNQDGPSKPAQVAEAATSGASDVASTAAAGAKDVAGEGLVELPGDLHWPFRAVLDVRRPTNAEVGTRAAVEICAA